jgi:hypothetical protein
MTLVHRARRKLTGRPPAAALVLIVMLLTGDAARSEEKPF